MLKSNSYTNIYANIAVSFQKNLKGRGADARLTGMGVYAILIGALFRIAEDAKTRGIEDKIMFFTTRGRENLAPTMS